jgi:transposase
MHGCPGARWRLDDLIATVEGLHTYSRSGVSRLLKRLGLQLKRGRLRPHSPDPDYVRKAGKIAAAVTEARTNPTTQVLLYADEASCYRQPSLADRWFPVGEEPTATLSCRPNTRHRICAGLNAVTGRVHWTAASTTTVAHLCRWLRSVRTAYPTQTVTIVWDNWPVHAHPRVLAEAEALQLRIRWLPTYAPWLNPIEKLWRWLKQTVLHQHRFADDWTALVDAMHAFLNRFKQPSPDLLRYVGLRSD